MQSSSTKTNEFGWLPLETDWTPDLFVIWRDDANSASEDRTANSVVGGFIMGESLTPNGKCIDVRRIINSAGTVGSSFSINNVQSIKNGRIYLPTQSNTLYYRAGHTYSIDYYAF